jgi:hypothetical protein
LGFFSLIISFISGGDDWCFVVVIGIGSVDWGGVIVVVVVGTTVVDVIEIEGFSDDSGTGS